MNYLKKGFFLLLITYSTYCYSDVTTINPAEELVLTTSLKCTFAEGIQTDWKNNSFQSQKAGFGNTAIYFDSINHNTSTARMIGNTAAISVKALLTQRSLTFIELTDSGNFIFTTIFPVKNINGDFIAVMSRHINIMNTPMLSQYYGMCKKWN